MAVRFDQDLSNLEANVSIFFPSAMPYLTPHIPPQLKHSHPSGKVTFKSRLHHRGAAARAVGGARLLT